MVCKIHHPNGILEGSIPLITSKSISNRVLIIRAQCREKFQIHDLSQAEDTQVLATLLEQFPKVWDVGPAGTSFRFLTAFLSFQPGEQTLTGSERMKKRPVKPLVDALRTLGAQIEYIGEEGFPPLRIMGPEICRISEVEVPSGISSQFVSALLLVAPALPDGLTIRLKGEVVSPSYIVMTLKILQYFGVDVSWDNNFLKVRPGSFHSKAYHVEADWSAASYYYALAAMAGRATIRLEGLTEKSLQGDAVIADLMEPLGVRTVFNEHGSVTIQKHRQREKKFEHEFISCPDLAQTMAVICAGLGIPGSFTGVQTLSIKETDRLAALHNELKKVHCSFLPTNNGYGEKYSLTGKATWSSSPRFKTYEDHRMAMSFAPFALKGEIEIDSPGVVGKSYPTYWEHLKNLGFEIEFREN